MPVHVFLGRSLVSHRTGMHSPRQRSPYFSATMTTKRKRRGLAIFKTWESAMSVAILLLSLPRACRVVDTRTSPPSPHAGGPWCGASSRVGTRKVDGALLPTRTPSRKVSEVACIAGHSDLPSELRDATKIGLAAHDCRIYTCMPLLMVTIACVMCV